MADRTSGEGEAEVVGSAFMNFDAVERTPLLSLTSEAALPERHTACCGERRGVYSTDFDDAFVHDFTFNANSVKRHHNANSVQ